MGGLKGKLLPTVNIPDYLIEIGLIECIIYAWLKRKIFKVFIHIVRIYD